MAGAEGQRAGQAEYGFERFHQLVHIAAGEIEAAVAVGEYRVARKDRLRVLADQRHAAQGVAGRVQALERYARRRERKAIVLGIQLVRRYRRKGLGKELILSLIEALRQRESRCLTLEVRDSNAPARALYEGLGFQEIGRRKNYYRNPKEDALIYKKEWTL